MKNNDMKKIKHIAFGLTTMAVLLLSGCTKDEAPDGADTGNKISAINVPAGGFTAAAGARSVADSDDTHVAAEDPGPS